jgi:hypothetical protein
LIALVAGPAAIKDGGSLLLVRPDEIPAAIAAELSRMQPDRIVVIGSSAAVNDSVFQQLQAYAPTTRIGGADRFALSAEVARVVFPTSKTVYVATGLNYPDALTAAPATAAASGPILLGGSIPGSEHRTARTSRQTIIVLGGPAAFPMRSSTNWSRTTCPTDHQLGPRTSALGTLASRGGILSAQPRFLDAPKRRRRIGDEAAVQSHHSGLEPFRHFEALALIPGVQVGHQAGPGVVGLGDGVVEVVEPTIGATGPKISVLEDPMLRAPRP